MNGHCFLIFFAGQVVADYSIKFSSELYITLQLTFTTKILCIHIVAWYSRINSQWYDIHWKYNNNARISPIIDSDLARPWVMGYATYALVYSSFLLYYDKYWSSLKTIYIITWKKGSNRYIMIVYFCLKGKSCLVFFASQLWVTLSQRLTEKENLLT